MINTYVNVSNTSTDILDLRGTEGAMSIILGNESDANISLAFGGEEAVLGSGTVLGPGETIVYDTQNVQINIIKAIAPNINKKLTVFADVATPGSISNFKLLNDIDGIMNENPKLSWDYTSNALSYDISYDNGVTWDNIGNVNKYTPTLGNGDYNIKIRARKGTLIGAETSSIDITIDRGAPALDTVTIASDNTDTTLAKVGDTITLTIVSAEDIQEPTITISGNTATVTEGINAKNWTAEYAMQSGDTEGVISFTIDYFDLAGNPGTQVIETTDSSAVTFDKTIPILNTVTIVSDNIDPTIADVGDTITITFTSDEEISTPTVTIDGNAADSITNTSGNEWEATRVMQSGDTQGVVGFTIDFNDLAGNSGVQVIATTDSSEVTFVNEIPYMLSAERLSNTTLKVFLSEDANDTTITKANDGGFVVYETGTPTTTYAVSAISKSGSNSDQIELTVADVTASAAIGLTVTYVAGGNGTVADTVGNLMETDAIGVEISAWA